MMTREKSGLTPGQSQRIAAANHRLADAHGAVRDAQASLADEILDVLAEDATLAAIARELGWSKQALHQWLKRKEKE